MVAYQKSGTQDAWKCQNSFTLWLKLHNPKRGSHFFFFIFLLCGSKEGCIPKIGDTTVFVDVFAGICYVSIIIDTEMNNSVFIKTCGACSLLGTVVLV